jgi:hypothetical protein
MGKTRLKIFIILISAILLLTNDKSDGCVDSFSDESDWLSLYMPEISGAASLMPFYYSVNGLYRSDDLWPNESRTKNTGEWFEYLGKKVSLKSIDTILYQSDAVRLTNTFDSILSGNNSDAEYRHHNMMLRYLEKNKKKDIIHYLLFAKETEHYLLHGDPWDPYKPLNNTGLISTVAAGEKLINTCTDSFLKIRYAYQCIKIYGNLAKTDPGAFSNKCISLYDLSFGKGYQNTTLKYWALFFKARCIAQKDSALSNYLLSKVFDSTDEKETEVYYNFNLHFLNQTLGLAKNNHEKAVILGLSIIQNPGKVLPVLQEIYRLDPANDKLGMLLTREINKLEQWIIMRPLQSIGEKNDRDYLRNVRKDRKYLASLLEFSTNAAFISHNTAEPGLWDVASGYMAFMLGKLPTANTFYALAGKEKNSENVELQLHLSKILLAIAGQDSATPAFEQQIYDGIKWMDRHNDKLTYGYHKNLLFYLAHRYEKLKNTGKAALLLFKANHFTYDSDSRGFQFSRNNGMYKEEYDAYGYLTAHARIEDFDEIISMIWKKNKTPFENYLTTVSLQKPVSEFDPPNTRQLNLSLILDRKATWFMNHNRIKEALETFKKIPDTLWYSEPFKTYLLCNPFYLNKWQPHRIHDSRKYTKVTALERILKMKNEIKKGKGNIARNYLLLGNAYYNMTYFGNFWMMNNYYWSINDLDVYYTNRVEKNALNENYYGCTLAMAYYLKAAENTKNAKLNALCLFMAEQCRKNYLLYTKLSHAKLPDAYKTKEPPFGKSLNPVFNKRIYASFSNCDTYVDYISDFY